jgi:hypothetical protein
MCRKPSMEPRLGDVCLKDVNMSDVFSAEDSKPRGALRKIPEREGPKSVYVGRIFFHRNIGLD